jgi:hypothetical protein
LFFFLFISAGTALANRCADGKQSVYDIGTGLFEV